MNLLRYLYRNSARGFWLAALCGLVSGLAATALVALINQALASRPGPEAWMGFAFFGLCLGGMVAKLIAEVQLLRLTQGAIYQMRIRLSQRLVATPLEQLMSMGKHRLLLILTEDINTLTHAFEWVPVLFVNSIIVLACLSYLAWLSGPMVLVLAGFLLTGLALFHFAERKPLEALAEARQQKDSLYQHFRSLIEGAKELKLNRSRATHFIGTVLADDADRYRRTFERGMAGYAWVANIGTQLFYLTIGLLLFIAPRWVPQAHAVLTGFTITLLYLIRPIVDSMIALPELRQASLSLARIRELEHSLDAMPLAEEAALPLASDAPLHIELQGIQHRYAREEDEQSFQLGPLDLSIRPGEILFIVGGNGSGKSTLALLLLGLLKPDAGLLSVNGIAIDDSRRDAYRQLFSAVFADFHLFEHLPGHEPERLLEPAERYLRALRMQHKVSVREGRFSTTALSTGQRKRLALIASYLEDRPIYLFDEWAADQDPVFKRIFYTELLPELQARGKTVIAITHDDAYFDCADRVVKLEDGQLKPVPRSSPDAQRLPTLA